MPHDLIQWVALIGVVGIAVMFLVEVIRWKRHGSVMGRGHKTLRVTLILLFEILFIMLFASPWIASRRDPMTSLWYWTLCLLIGLAIVILAMLDVLVVVKKYQQLNRQAFYDLMGKDRRGK